MLSWGTAVLGQTMPLKNNDLPPEVQARFAGQPGRSYSYGAHTFFYNRTSIYVYT